MPKISIIIPVYNAEKFLAKCLDSVLMQTFTDFECILINDGSLDNSPAICAEYSEKDARIKIIHKNNGGASSARNAGLDIALGEWIIFIDSDDWVHNNYLELLLTNALNNNCKLSICDKHYISEESSVKNLSHYSITFFDKDSAKKALFTSKKIGTETVCKLIKREYIYDIRFDTSIIVCEDGLFWFEIISKMNASDRIVYDSTPCYSYLRHENAITRSSAMIDNHMTIFSATKKMIQSETNKEIKKIIKSYETRIASGLCRILLEPGKFNIKTYNFYRKRIFFSLFYYLTDHDIKTKKKIIAIFYLFPLFYTFAKKVKRLTRLT